MARLTVAERNKRAKLPVSRNVVTPTVLDLPQHRLADLPKRTGVGPRHGKCPQKIGMWGTLSTDYTTPGMTTHDSRYSQTVQNRNV